jgi:hypothetical protein
LLKERSLSGTGDFRKDTHTQVDGYRERFQFPEMNKETHKVSGMQIYTYRLSVVHREVVRNIGTNMTLIYKHR